MQELPGKVGNAPATHMPSGDPLLFPELAYFETHPTHSAVIDMARQWMMCTMFCGYYGHMTPGRPYSHVCSVTHPDFIARCTFVHCKDKNCKGNRLEEKDGGKSHQLVIPHSKTSNRWASQWSWHCFCHTLQCATTKKIETP